MKWLKKHGYIAIERRTGRSSLYKLIPQNAVVSGKETLPVEQENKQNTGKETLLPLVKKLNSEVDTKNIQKGQATDINISSPDPEKKTSPDPIGDKPSDWPEEFMALVRHDCKLHSFNEQVALRGLSAFCETSGLKPGQVDIQKLRDSLSRFAKKPTADNPGAAFIGWLRKIGAEDGALFDRRREDPPQQPPHAHMHDLVEQKRSKRILPESENARKVSQLASGIFSGKPEVGAGELEEEAKKRKAARRMNWATASVN